MQRKNNERICLYDDNYNDTTVFNCSDIQGSCFSIEECYVESLVNEGIPLYEGRDCLYDLPLEMLEQIAEDVSIKITFVS